MNFLLILPVVIPVVLSLVWRWLRLEGKKLSIATLATVAGSAALAAACALIPGTGQISLRWTDMLTFSLLPPARVCQRRHPARAGDERQPGHFLYVL